MPLLNYTPNSRNTFFKPVKTQKDTNPNYDILIRHFSQGKEIATSLTNRALPKPPKRKDQNYNMYPPNRSQNQSSYTPTAGYVSIKFDVGTYLNKEKIDTLDAWKRKLWPSSEITNAIMNNNGRPGLWKTFNIFGSSLNNRRPVENPVKRKSHRQKLSKRVNPKFLPSKLNISDQENSPVESPLPTVFEKAPGGKINGISPHDIKSPIDNSHFHYPKIGKNHNKKNTNPEPFLQCPECQNKLLENYSKVQFIQDKRKDQRHILINLKDMINYKFISQPRTWGAFSNFTVLPYKAVCSNCNHDFGRIIEDNDVSRCPSEAIQKQRHVLVRHSEKKYKHYDDYGTGLVLNDGGKITELRFCTEKLIVKKC